jgi:hypothetical protein
MEILSANRDLLCAMATDLCKAREMAGEVLQGWLSRLRDPDVMDPNCEVPDDPLTPTPITPFIPAASAYDSRGIPLRSST